MIDLDDKAIKNSWYKYNLDYTLRVADSLKVECPQNLKEPEEPEEMCPEIDCIQDNIGGAIKSAQDDDTYSVMVSLAIADDQLEHLRGEISKLRTWGHYWKKKAKEETCSK